MPNKVKEVELDFIHYIVGFIDTIPEGLIEFLTLRTDLKGLKKSVPSSLLTGCTKSKAKKLDWVKAFINLPPLERRKLTMRNPELIPLLPRDVKRLGLKEQKACTPCGKRTFNPGKAVSFNVYGVFEVMSVLTSSKNDVKMTIDFIKDKHHETEKEM